MKDQTWFNFVALALAAAVLLGALVAPAVANVFAPQGNAPVAASTTSYVNLTISINATTGWPQYSPANFTVPQWIVVFTITDTDSAMSWAGCQRTVQGTVPGTETVNGTSYSVVSSANVAHTFSIPTLGVNALSPGQSVVSFTLDVPNAGTFEWYCMAPCGTAPGGYSGGPMGLPGYMSGTMTVL